jgi:hypothetical protein
MLGEPPGDCRRRPVRQQVDGLVGFDVDQDRAVDVALPEREVVHPEHPRCRGLGLRQAADQPQQRRLAHPSRQSLGQAGAGAAGQHHRHALQHPLQAGAASAVADRQPVDLLGKRRLPAGTLTTAETPHL